jgi:hypothetical protein
MNVVDFYQAVLEKLEAVGQGQSATQADALKVQTAYEALLEILTDEDLADWSPSDDLPEWAVTILTSMTAAELITEFGVEGARATQLIAEGAWNLPAPLGPSMAERRLRRHQAAPYISTPARPDYF